MKLRSQVILAGVVFVAALGSAGCSAFQIRHVDENGKTRTYVTDTVYTGTGTILDCVISPLHWALGLFYLQPYVRGESMRYPTFGGSGCFGHAYGDGVVGFVPVVGDVGLFARNGPPRVRFLDANGKEVEISGGSIEIMRVSDRIHFGPN